MAYRSAVQTEKSGILTEDPPLGEIADNMDLAAMQDLGHRLSDSDRDFVIRGDRNFLGRR